MLSILFCLEIILFCVESLMPRIPAQPWQVLETLQGKYNWGWTVHECCRGA